MTFSNTPCSTRPLGLVTILAFLSMIWLPRGDAQARQDTPAGRSQRPNILIILADDLGFSDLGSYGGEIRTPTLDRLARGGLRFTQFYNSSRCCPSRASLLTGVYPHQAGIGHFVRDGGKLPGYQGRLSEQTVTIAEVLEQGGYNTYMVGKWHVNDPPPTERGFDEFYGFTHGYAVDAWNPQMMVRLPEGRPERQYAEGDYFATDALTDYALDFLDISDENAQPWMMYVAYQAPHFPVQAPPELTATYTDTYLQGWDTVREQRMERLKDLGLIGLDVPLSPRGPVDLLRVAQRIGSGTDDGHNPAWDTLPPKRRADLAQRMAVYAASIERMDQNIGRLVSALEERGELENTLILFTSDNGACAEWEPYGFSMDPEEYRDQPRGHGIDGGTPGLPNLLHEGDALSAMGGPDSLFSYGSGWANASNTPLRLYKHYAHEGGIRAPFIAHWPAGIREVGGITRFPGHIMDIMATCVEVSGVPYPTVHAGRPILPMEGVSLTTAFAGEAAPERTLVFEHERNAAIREGDWKLVASNVVLRDGLRPGARWELYNLKDDPTEQTDLATRHPDRVASMKARFLEEARRTSILPRP